MEGQSRLSGLDNNRNDKVNTRPYSSAIRVLKLILPLFAIGLIMILIIWPQLSAVPTEPLNEADLEAIKSSERENRLLNPTFSVEDNKGRPIRITAIEAVQYKDNDAVINLSTPHATLRMSEADNDTSDLTADEGVFDRKAQIITLTDNVIIKGQKDDITLQTDSLTADLKSGRAESNAQATLTSPQGTITGQKVIVENNGAKTIFEGPAKAVINQ